MKCYRCKKNNLTTATRVFMPAKNGREKDGFRDICDECYPAVMKEKGYILIDGIWHGPGTEKRRKPEAQYSQPLQRENADGSYTQEFDTYSDADPGL